MTGSGDRHRAIALAKDAYSWWLKRAMIEKGFMPLADGYMYRCANGYTVYLNTNGTIKSTTKETVTNG